MKPHNLPDVKDKILESVRQMNIKDKDSDDGYRILVDRIWPRGIVKSKVDLWLKDIAPSAELRKWYDHVNERYCPFKILYTKELNVNEFTLEFINICKKHLLYENVTLLYAAHSEKENNAIILREWIQNRMLLL
ncbi:MAG: DUF488 family protein [Lachnospira sp.]|nr:DUF488 family protein [Lachnospira sp.]